MTSHDVIGFLRRMLNTKKIGHGGTLDPDAAGVLPVFAGSATRLLEFAVEGRKEYIAEFTLGAQTVTGDDSGEVVKTMPVPAFGKQELEAVLAQFTGKQLQLPPMYSAIKINGKQLYCARGLLQGYLYPRSGRGPGDGAGNLRYDELFAAHAGGSLHD